MIAALVMFAAIFTQQNDVYTKTSDLATFGSNTTGIASRWIPWGTYTDGSGSAEVLRVTTNLVGVVASVFDGFEERTYLPYEVRPEDLSVRYIYVPTPQATAHFEDAGEYLRTTNNTLRITDALNASRYIYYYPQGTNYGYDVGSTTGGDNIEKRLAYTYHYPGEYHVNNGLASYFGGERLDAIVEELGGIDPPIGKTWSADLPFLLADRSAWALTWPTYSALTNDIHFFPLPETGIVHYCSHAFTDWTDPSHLVEVWGSDVNDEAYILVTNVEEKCLPVTMEDVLKVDPGWEYNYPPQLTNDYWMVDAMKFERGSISGEGGEPGSWDDLAHAVIADWIYKADPLDWQSWYYVTWNAWYGGWVYRASGEADIVVSGEPTAQSVDFGNGIVATKTEFWADADDFEHWMNMTTRLDWKRLGTICQLERHMETTYRARDEEDYMPFQRMTAGRTHVYEGEVAVSFVDDGGNIVAATNLNPRLASWNLVTQVVECASTNFGWCFPTARLENTYEIGDLRSASASGGVEVYAPSSLFEGVLESLGTTIAQMNDLKDGSLVIEISGTFTPEGLSGFVWPWYVDWASFYPNDGGEGQYYTYPSMSGTETVALSMLPTNAVFGLVMSVGKRAATMQTDETAQATTITNFVAYPSTNIWARSWVGVQERPTLEVMIDAKGSEFEAYAHQYGDETMNWNDIKTWTNKTRRVFRMSPECAPKGTRDLSDFNRWQMLESLDAEVKARFSALAGMGIGQAAQNLVNFAAGEENALKNQLLAQRLDVRMSLEPDAPPPPWLVLIGSVDIDRDGVVGGASLYSTFFAYYTDQDTTTKEIVPTSDGYLVGHLTFSVGSSSITNQVIDVKPVRVDGHQDQIIKTRWRFRNLRDANL